MKTRILRVHENANPKVRAMRDHNSASAEAVSQLTEEAEKREAALRAAQVRGSAKLTTRRGWASGRGWDLGPALECPRLLCCSCARRRGCFRQRFGRSTV
eukprot:359814-Chlamydomonas_euryale.AAC.12